MLVAILITAIAVILSVSVHLGVLRFLYQSMLPRLIGYKRIVVGLMVLGAAVGHLLEIGIFSLGMEFLASQAGIPHTYFDSAFWSATAYTSLGSEYPQAYEVRLLAAVTALTGLILITWTASLLFLLMQKYWQEKTSEK